MKDVGLLILRLGFSIPMMTHGYGKLMRLLEGKMSFADPIGIGEVPSLILVVLAEFFCPIFIILGYKTRYTAIPVILTMLVAALIQHFEDPFREKEMAILFAVGYLSISLLGPGKYSIDRR